MIRVTSKYGDGTQVVAKVDANRFRPRKRRGLSEMYLVDGAKVAVFEKGPEFALSRVAVLITSLIIPSSGSIEIEAE